MPQQGWRWPQRAIAVLLAVAVLVGVLAQGPGAAADVPVHYEAPVDARVVDPFRVEGGPYSRGNRGLEYGTAPGAVVRAAADGVVTFAGSVGNSRHVTVLHDDGVRTSYSFLDEVRVVRGQRVRQGQAVGTTRDRLHFGARRGDAYFDPATLFDDRPVVYLVPFDEPPGLGPGSERSAIRQLIGGFADAGRAVAHGGGAALAITTAGARWAAGHGSEVWRGLAHYATRFSPFAIGRRIGAAALQAWKASHRPCTKDSVIVPPLRHRHAALLVGGHGSSSTNAAADTVDTEALGYRPDDVVRYSYAGGRIPLRDGRGASFAGLPEQPYTRIDTEGDILAEGDQFADFVESVIAEQPGLPVDVFAHSQGGLVARRGLEVLAERHGAQWVLDHVNLFATIASPHGGADAATAARMINHTNVGDLGLDAARLAIPIDADSTAFRQLGEHSEVIDHFRDTPVLEGLNALAVGVSSDLAVPVPRSRARGMRSTVVHHTGPTAHDDAPGLAATTRELALALDHRPPGCRGFGEAFRDELTGEAVSLATDGIGAAGWVGGMRAGG